MKINGLEVTLVESGFYKDDQRIGEMKGSI